MQPELMSLGESTGGALAKWQTAYADIQSAGVGVDLPSAHTPGSVVRDIDFRVTAGLSAVARLRGAKHTQLELIAHRLPGLKGAVETIETQAQSISGTLEQWHGATAADRNGHLNLQLSHSEKGATTFDLGSPLATINQQAVVLLDALPYISQITGDDTIPVFGGLARAASEHLAQAKISAEGAQAELKTGASAVADLQELVARASQLIQKVDDTLVSVTGTKGSTEQQAAEILQKLAQVREVSKDADTLQQRVASFNSQFEAFESQMKARLEMFAEFENSTKEAARINKEREEKIAELTTKADTMIRGATTAGLSKSLEDAKAQYETRLARTQWFFLGSVVFLLVSALPVAAQLIPGPWQQYFLPGTSDAASGSGPWLGALGKLILVLPGTWATAFFAANYAELFHLSREYAHKAALAKAIDGFQREAPTYKDEIVGSVFMEIQDNPGSRKAPAAATPQNPVTKKFLQLVLEAIKAKKPE